MTTREVYVVAERGDITLGVECRRDERAHQFRLWEAIGTGQTIEQVEAVVRASWPGRAFWIEQDLGDGVRYQLVEYGAFANKPHKAGRR